MAFYKYLDDVLYAAPNAVIAPGYSLYKEQKDTYTYPVNGWYWFDKEKDAIEALNVYIPDTTFTIVGLQEELNRDPTGDKFKVFDKFWKKYLKYMEKGKLDKLDELIIAIEDPTDV